MKAMILAAGLGTRMRPLTDHLPKPLLPVGDSTLIELHLYALAKAGIKEVVINVSYLADMIVAHLGSGERYGLDIKYSKEDQLLETAGGLRYAQGLLGDEPFILLNADIWTNYNFVKLKEQYEKLKVKGASVLAHLVLIENPEHNLKGDFSVVAGDSETEVFERPVLEKQSGVAAEHLLSAKSLDGKKYTFSGMSCIHPKLLDLAVDSNRLAAFLLEAAKNKQVSVEYFPGAWVDVGTPERLAQIKALS